MSDCKECKRVTFSRLLEQVQKQTDERIPCNMVDGNQKLRNLDGRSQLALSSTSLCDEENSGVLTSLVEHLRNSKVSIVRRRGIRREKKILIPVAKPARRSDLAECLVASKEQWSRM
jgi:hypothetical protein